MSNKNDFWKSLFKVGAFIGGAWLTAELIKALSKRIYRCPNCNNIIPEGAKSCQNCKVNLIWK